MRFVLLLILKNTVMKLHLHLPKTLLLGSSTPKLGFMPKTVLQNFITQNKNLTTKNSFKLNKLLPQHWFDGVWDNLDYKM